MKTEIIGRNVQVDDRLRAVVEQKLEKLERFLEEPIEMRVTLAAEKHSHVAELHVTHRLGVLQASEEADGNLLEAVHRVLDNIEEQARRAHQKVVDKRRRGERSERSNDRRQRWPVDVLDQESVGGGGVPRVIETDAPRHQADDHRRGRARARRRGARLRGLPGFRRATG